MAINYATAMRGGCHVEGMTYYVESGAYPREALGLQYDGEIGPDGTGGKAEIAAKMQDILAMFNALGLCKFLIRPQVTVDEIAGWVKSVHGIDITGDEIRRADEREFNLRRLCSVAAGITRKDDTLPPRLLSQPRPTGRAAGQLPFLGKMLNDYYNLRGWDPEGIPTLTTLARLNLVDYLDKVGIPRRRLSK
jgi:aldehyde:ferredoxin oxidoreductase